MNISSLTTLGLAAICLLQATMTPQPINPSPPNNVLSKMSLVTINGVETLRITGVNVQIVNGAGSTETENSAGNLIIGYNEIAAGGNDRSGSHNIVVGPEHTFNSHGGLVTGEANNITGAHSAVIASAGSTTSALWSFAGGTGNASATGSRSAVVGGRLNVAGGLDAVVLGGFQNIACDGSIVVGGETNMAGVFDAYIRSVIIGGQNNVTSGPFSVIMGGLGNMANGFWSVITGGQSNFTGGSASWGVVGGGLSNSSVIGPHDWSAGTLFEDQ